MGILKEFKEFAYRGNVIDLAIGVIIGGAFGKIVSSLVNDFLMPPLGLLLGGVDFKDLALVLKKATINEAGETVDAVTLNYGIFIQNLVDFIIIAFVIFMAIRFVKKLNGKKNETPSAPPAPTPSEKLLEEIRDLLRK
jgi:large conductance mechanosensitive channel